MKNSGGSGARTSGPQSADLWSDDCNVVAPHWSPDEDVQRLRTGGPRSEVRHPEPRRIFGCETGDPSLRLSAAKGRRDEDPSPSARLRMTNRDVTNLGSVPRIHRDHGEGRSLRVMQHRKATDV